MSDSTALGRVLGRGSAKSGVGHWRVQRLTAIALAPLALWFIASLASLSLADHAAVSAWIGGTWHPVALSLFVICVCWHSCLGVQVVIEDYVHGHAVKLLALVLINFAHVLAAAGGVFATLKIAFSVH